MDLCSDAVSEPKVTVIIPFYQVELYIGACIESVLGQDYPNLEILLVDDASTDNSRLIANRFAADDPRLRILTHDKNRGPGPARNTGARAATGTWLIYLDSDDLLARPTAIRSLVAAALGSNCRVVIGSCDQLLPDGSIVDFDRGYDLQLGGKPGQVMAGIDAYRAAWGRPDGAWLPIRATGLLIETLYYNELGLEFPRGEHEDLCFTPILYYRSGGVYYNQEIVLLYRYRYDSISNTPWSAARIRRYAETWRSMGASLRRYGLEEQLGNTAIKFAESMLWKLQAHSADHACDEDILCTLEEILTDAGNTSDIPLFCWTMDQIRRSCDFIFQDSTRYRRLTAGLSSETLLLYYRSRLDHLGVTVTSGRAVTSGSPVTTDVPQNGHGPNHSLLADALLMCDRCVADLARRAGPPEASQVTRTSPGETETATNDADRRARQAEERYNAIVTSTSWRITAPLRRLAMLFQR